VPELFQIRAHVPFFEVKSDIDLLLFPLGLLMAINQSKQAQKLLALEVKVYFLLFVGRAAI
jgi:hypothetical protein